jgi:hypothetical protein
MRSTTRKGHQQDAARIRATNDQVRDAMGQRVRFARTGAGNDQQRVCSRRLAVNDAVLDRAALF